MASEQANIMEMWEELSFPGKEMYKLDEHGVITLSPTALVKEREIGVVSPDTLDTVVKNLQEKFEQMMSKVREMEVEWMATEDKNKLADKIEQLKGLINSTQAIGDFEKAAQIVNDWESSIKKASDENLAAKKALAEQAEALADSTDWKETTQVFRDLNEKWRLSGFLDKSRNDALWNRIDKARERFLDRKRAHHSDEEKDLLVALDMKLELAEEAESMTMSEDWKATTEKYLNIIERWKGLGRTMPKKNEELWQRIMTAKNHFFDRKKAHFDKIQQEQEANFAIKEALVEKAEALKESTNWGATTNAMTALMEEWKKTGRAPHDKAEEQWKRFNDAQDHFFQAKKRYNDDMRKVQDANYELKSALLARAEELKDSTKWGETTAELNRIFDEWKTIGPVPREHNNRIWDAFIAARRHFFDRKDADREQRKQQNDAYKAAREARDIADKKHREAREKADRKDRIEHAKRSISGVHHELAEEKEKLADFKNAIQNIAPGKKAEELRAHLTNLISESEKHIAALEKKIVKVTEEMTKVIEHEEKHEAAPAADATPQEQAAE